MNSWKNLTAMAIATMVLGTSAIAQKTDKKKDSKEESKEIIIKKKGDNEKMTIVVDGDKITLNGKPIEDIDDADITIHRGGDARGMSPRARVWAGPRAPQVMQELEHLQSMGGNKALLGVVTEKGEGGAKITDVSKESGAEKAGLKEGDVITKLGDKKIESSNDLIAAIGAYKPQDKVDIMYKRAGKELKANATLGENKKKTFHFDSDEFSFGMPGMPAAPFGQSFGMTRKPKIGMQIQDLEEGSGVSVSEVDEDSPASKAGMKEGDVITLVNGKAIAGVDELRTEIKDIKEGDVVKMTYRRGTATQTADIKLPKKLKTANL